ncbi:tol-pal system protein YbgF [Ectothiorhodospira mobilis]|uniref:tol-pal system protein YbgF n=1 Tax=Ectothiorhodospira mobilis TaxID=195064 RepID=UPI0019088FCB|nr:tol-pal system protein YbgF [Ectothiorhodospira mobilis]MBK1691351.1 tol-pal system protein YbgF [Ectothiorhodospira mobilis]
MIFDPHRLPPLLLSPLLAALLTLPAQAQQSAGGAGTLEARVERLERILDNADLMGLFNRLQALEAQVRELRGDNEALRHELERLKTRQRDLYLDVDGRLQALEQAGASAHGEGGNAPQAIQPLPRPGEGPGEGDAPPAQGDGEDQAAYQAAFDRLRAGAYRKAIEAFSTFLKTHPDSPLAANAQYWLGEGYYVTGDFERALEAFAAVPGTYPESNKVPDARLKQGYTLYELERWSAAREVLEAVRTDYPDTTVARLAEQRLQMLGERGE